MNTRTTEGNSNNQGDVFPLDKAENWPSPNNNYMGKCCLCKIVYLGPKRSVLCFSCENGKRL